MPSIDSGQTGFYVYVDRTADTGEVFYVGKGSGRRAQLLERNRKHANVAGAHGLLREIVWSVPCECMEKCTCGAEIEAFEHEARLISELHTFVDDPEAGRLMCNFTTGGEGWTLSREAREKKSMALKGNKNALGWKHTPESKARLSAANMGTHRTADTRAKMSASHKGKPKSAEHRAKLSEVNRGKRHSDETRAKIGAGLMGNQNALGYAHPEQTREKMSVVRQGQVRMPHTDAARAKMHAAKKGKRVQHRVPVLQLDVATGDVIGRFSMVKEAAEAIGVPYATMVSTLRHRGTLKGYRWMRACEATGA